MIPTWGWEFNHVLCQALKLLEILLFWREAEFATPRYAFLAYWLSWAVIFKKEQTQEKLWKLSKSTPLSETFICVREISISKGVFSLYQEEDDQISRDS